MSEVVAHISVIALVAVVALGAAVAVLARGASVVARGGGPAPGPRARTLSARERVIVAACADALFPSGGPIPLSGTEAGLVDYMDRYVARAPRPLRPYMRLLLHFIELSPWVFGPCRARFTRLSHEDRIAALASMAQSRIYFRRLTFLSLRTMLSMGYLANEKVARAIGVTCCAAPFDRRAARTASDRDVLGAPPLTTPEVTV
jgi:hypothetical protein